MSTVGERPGSNGPGDEPGQNPEGEPAGVSGDNATSAPPSAGEMGDAGAAEAPANGSDPAEVIVGEIPDAHDLSHLLWTARCTEHGLLGHFESKEEAEQAKVAHLESEHS